jgi:hypothetical protein
MSGVFLSGNVGVRYLIMFILDFFNLIDDNKLVIGVEEKLVWAK